MRLVQWFLVLTLYCSLALAELSRDVRDYERVLVPIAIPVAKSTPTGTWQTRGLVSNQTTAPVYVGQGDMHACQISIPCPERGRMNADSTIRLYVAPSLVLPIGSPQNPGAVFFVERPFENSVTFSNRLLNLATGKAVPLPFVRERTFAEISQVRLLDVPMTRGAVTLRVYDPYDRENVIVEVRVTDAATGVVLAAGTLGLRYEWEAPSSRDFPMYPAYAIVGDLRPLLTQPPDSVKIDVKTVGGEKGIWAMASVTEADGDVLLIYPQ